MQSVVRWILYGVQLVGLMVIFIYYVALSRSFLRRARRVKEVGKFVRTQIYTGYVFFICAAAYMTIGLSIQFADLNQFVPWWFFFGSIITFMYFWFQLVKRFK